MPAGMFAPLPCLYVCASAMCRHQVHQRARQAVGAL
jgi:hypothetical protein